MLDVIKDLLILMISSSLVSNVVLSQFLGLCPFLGVSKKVDTAVGMGGAVIFVITIASGVAAVIYKLVLVPFDITICRNVFEKVCSSALSGAWGISSANYNKLCSAWNCTHQCTEKIWDWF